METHPPSIGARLRAARKLAGISARELDRLAGRAEGHTAIIERSEGEAISTHVASALASALGLTLDWLIDGDGDAPSEAAVRAAVERARERRAASGAEDAA